jgi:hypothetical protein
MVSVLMLMRSPLEAEMKGVKATKLPAAGGPPRHFVVRGRLQVASADPR